MPLIHSGSEPALKRNISTLMHDVGRSPHVQSRAQALAIAFANQRRHRDAGGGLPPGQSPFLNPLAAPQGSYAPPTPTPTPAPAAAPPPAPTMVTSQPDVASTPPPSASFSGPATGIAPPMRTSFGPAGGAADPSAGSTGSLAGLSSLLSQYGSMSGIGGAFGGGGMGLRGMAGGGMAPPWYVRSEARQMGHTGPIQSHVAGRTDHIPLNVPAGSYVIPADIVSGRGQGNSAAGLKLMHSMFSSGPFGSPMPKIAHGAGPPKPPGLKGVGAPMAGIKMPKFADGGAPDASESDGYQETDETVPIMAAGGEYVIHPKTVWMIGGGSIDLGHKILDHWVKSERQSLIKTLKNLPGPARD